MEVKALKNYVEKNKMHDALTAIAKEINSINIPLNNKQDELNQGIVSNYNIKQEENKVNVVNRKLLISRFISILYIWAKQQNKCFVKNDKAILKLFRSSRNLQKICKCKKVQQRSSKISIITKYADILNRQQCDAVQEKVKNYCEPLPKYFSDTRKECKLLKQRNRFLKNKIKILEYNIKSLENENNTQNFRIKKLLNEISTYKIINKTSNDTILSDDLKSFSNQKIDCISHFKFKTHLSVVKGLLVDQKTMLQQLQKLAEEINNTQ